MSVKSIVERRAPRMATLWRMLRDRVALRMARPRRLAEGGLLVGGEAVAVATFELEERKLVAGFLDLTDVFVDVGANVGLYTVIARARGVRAVAIEPHPINLRYLHRTLRANGWSDVEVVPHGVGREEGTARLYGGATGASLLRGWAAATDVDARTVRVTTLDALLAHRFEGSRLFVKIDIEGFEYDALLGAAALLRRTPRPRWLVEITLVENRAVHNAHFAETFDLFFDAGYRAFVANSEMREVTRADVRAWSTDLVRNFLFL